MNENERTMALRVVESVLHQTMSNREQAKALAQQIVDILAENWQDAIQHYSTSDLFELCDLAARDYVRQH